MSNNAAELNLQPELQKDFPFLCKTGHKTSKKVKISFTSCLAYFISFAPFLFFCELLTKTSYGYCCPAFKGVWKTEENHNFCSTNGETKAPDVIRHPNTCTDQAAKFFPVQGSNRPTPALSDTWEKRNKMLTVSDLTKTTFLYPLLNIMLWATLRCKNWNARNPPRSLKPKVVLKKPIFSSIFS